jgi:hypothetical protein
MSRARHKNGGAVHSDEAQDRKLIKEMMGRKTGGRVPADAGGNQDVMSEAKSGSAKVAFRDGGCVEGGKSRMRLDRPGRKTGGRVFSNPLSASSSMAPMTEASKVSSKAAK